MSKSLIVVAIVGLAVLALPGIMAQADGGEGVKVIVNGQPLNPAPGGSVVTIGEGREYGDFVPPVPTPPGVIGQYSPLPFAVPYAPRAGGSVGESGYFQLKQ